MTTALNLRIIGKDGDRLVPIDQDILWVGRAPNADIRIDDLQISRRQFSIERVRTPAGLAVRVRINPESPNAFAKDGVVARELAVGPGESFTLGVYRFELGVRPSGPELDEIGLPPDPAGRIDVNLAEEHQRIAPRWMLSGSEQQGGEQGARRSKVLTPMLAALGAVGLAGAWMLGVFDSAPASAEPPLASSRTPELFNAIPRLECDGQQACLARAVEAVQLANKLQQSGSRDLLTVYRIARHLHRAYITLGPDAGRINDLAEKYDTAKTEIETVFGDLYFRLKRAVINENQRDQLAMLRAIYPLCEEDPHKFCEPLELFYKRLRD